MKEARKYWHVHTWLCASQARKCRCRWSPTCHCTEIHMSFTDAWVRILEIYPPQIRSRTPDLSVSIERKDLRRIASSIDASPASYKRWGPWDSLPALASSGHSAWSFGPSPIPLGNYQWHPTWGKINGGSHHQSGDVVFEVPSLGILRGILQ